MAFETLTLPAHLEYLATATSFIEEQAERLGLAEDRKFGLLIALEEAFVNICHYAYAPQEGTVSISCGSEGMRFVVEISDEGTYFDLLSLPDPDITSDLMDRQIGGLGVFFIRKLTDDVSYRREDGRNILRLTLQTSQDQE